MLEFLELEKAKKFSKDHKGSVKIGGQECKATIFTSKLSAWESSKPPLKSRFEIHLSTIQMYMLHPQNCHLKVYQGQECKQQSLPGNPTLKSRCDIH